MKKLTAIILSVLLVALAGCTAQSANVNPVGFDAAKAAALEAAGVAAADAVFDEAVLKEYKGHQYYEIEFDANGREYEYYIEALSGTVITPELAAEALGGTVNVPTGEKQPAAQEISENPQPKADEPAVAEVSSNPPAQSGTVAQQSAGEVISEAKAKEIALNHAGKKEADVKFVKVKLEWDDGRQEYEVEFYDGDFIEYDYEIDAVSGKILSYDFDAEDYSKPANPPAQSNPSAPSASQSTSENTISAEKAKAIALAQVPGASESHIREFKADRDDGRLEYEGEIVYDGVEYEFEIDGYSGAIRNWDVESVKKSGKSSSEGQVKHDRDDDDWDDRFDDDDDDDDWDDRFDDDDD